MNAHDFWSLALAGKPPVAPAATLGYQSEYSYFVAARTSVILLSEACSVVRVANLGQGRFEFLLGWHLCFKFVYIRSNCFDFP